MPITFACACGRQLQMGDEYAGKKARCPECQAVVTVPAAAPVFPAAPLPSRRSDPPSHEDDVAGTADSLNPLEARGGSRRRQRDVEGEDDGVPIRSRPPARNWLNTITIGGIVCLSISLLMLVFALVTGVYFRAMFFLAVVGVVGVIRGLIVGRDE